MEARRMWRNCTNGNTLEVHVLTARPWCFLTVRDRDGVLLVRRRMPADWCDSVLVEMHARNTEGHIVEEIT